MTVDFWRALARMALCATAALMMAAPAHADRVAGRSLHIANGCTGCHAAKYGASRSTFDAAIVNQGQMNQFSTLTGTQRDDIVDYLSTSGNFAAIDVSTSTVNFATTASSPVHATT